MPRILCAVLVSVLFSCGFASSMRGDEQDVKAVLDKAIKALGGEEKLKQAETCSEKVKASFTFNGNSNEFMLERTFQGLDHYRAEIDGAQFKVTVVLDGDKGWRKFGDNKAPLEGNDIANEKRRVYLSLIPATIVPLKGKAFKIEAVADEKIGDKPVAVLKITPPDNKEFTIAFDQESGLPVRLIAKVAGFQGDEFTQETTLSDYKDYKGIKRAAKVEQKRDGQPFFLSELIDFKVLDKVAPDTFAEPQ